MGKTRAVVNVSTTPHYQIGQKRLSDLLTKYSPEAQQIFWKEFEPDWPAHFGGKPFAFKAYALWEASKKADILLWCDASIKPIRSLEPLWEHIEEHGYWLAPAGCNNYEWTSYDSYKHLFPDRSLEEAIEINKTIPHVIGTSFGVNKKHWEGSSLLDLFYYMATDTNAFCGPWTNEGDCGPPEVKGHRHDQTVLSVISYEFGDLELHPEFTDYSATDKRNCLLIDGGTYEPRCPVQCPKCGSAMATVEVDDGYACNRCGTRFHS